MDFISLLSAPVPYLEQKKHDFCKQDNKGFTALHYAVLTMNFEWLNDVLNINQDNMISLLSKNSNDSSILVEHLQVLGQPKKKSSQHQSKDIQNKDIPFGDEGYTPVHLLIWMMSHYEKDNHIEKSQMLNTLSAAFHSLFERNNKILTIVDGNGLSVLEYIIMLNQENLMNGKLEAIEDLSFLPKLTNETLGKLVEHRSAQNIDIRKKIYNRILAIQNKEIINKTLNSTPIKEDTYIGEDDNFKL